MTTALQHFWLFLFAAVLLINPPKVEESILAQEKEYFSDSLNKPDVTNLTGSWQLMVDDYLIEQKEQVVRTYHPFHKYEGNPVLKADKPWEGRLSYLYGTVLPSEKENGYRMWYHAWTGEYVNLYATSQDGITWDKPNLDIIDYQGSTDNNIFFRRTVEDHLPQVIYTPWESDSTRRYKLLNYDYGRTPPDNLVSGFWGAYSADGIHWTDVEQNPVLKDPGDVGNFVWDTHTERYIGYPKIFAPIRGFNRRCVGFTATRDFEHWPSAQLILVPDEIDDQWVSSQDQRTEFYGLSAFPYQAGYIGFLWIFHITDGKSDGPIFCELVSSHNGINWVRQETTDGMRTPILPIGPAGSWDQGMVFTSNHPLVEDDQIKLWYGGSTATHSARVDSSRSAIGLATLRKDGFASLDASEEKGVITTKLLKNVSGQIRVNADAEKGSLKVELLRADGTVIPGFSQDECKSITTNGLDTPVLWGNQCKLPDSLENIRIRFVLQNASLYSFHAGDKLDLVNPSPAAIVRLDFETNESPSDALHGSVLITYTEKFGKTSKTAQLLPNATDSIGKIELLNTAQLGPKFTLAARVKSQENQPFRLFSNYRGDGEKVTGELVFEVDTNGENNSCLRFTVNGQSVASSPPVTLDSRKFHHFAATFNGGEIILYLDGSEVSRGRTELGVARLTSKDTVLRNFERPNALPKVGITLGSNLMVGADLNGRFFNYEHTGELSSHHQLKGYVDDILVERRVLSENEIKQLFKGGKSN